MRTIKQNIELPEISYPIETIAPLDKLLFFDIETTGFNASNSNVYLIGCIFYDGTSFQLMQWFAEKYEEERAIISDFMSFIKDYSHLIHFNGNNFDIPFLVQKCEELGIEDNISAKQGVDLYKRVVPYKYFLNLNNCKQKTIELFLGINRKDTYDGGELINVYHNYVKEASNYDLNLLLLHNADDMKGMVRILPILLINDLFTQPLKAKKVQANTYKDYFGTEHQELLIRVSLPCVLPVPIRRSAGSCHFRGEGKIGTFRVPIYREEMKYFYANYKDYYYLPEEDMAVHKSVAEYADKQFRTKATAATCYTRKYSVYLPQWDVLQTPFFKRDYKSKELFFELSDEIKTSRELFSRYSEHILQMLAESY